MKRCLGVTAVQFSLYTVSLYRLTDLYIENLISKGSLMMLMQAAVHMHSPIQLEGGCSSVTVVIAFVARMLL